MRKSERADMKMAVVRETTVYANHYVTLFPRPIARKWCMVNEAEGGLNRGCGESTENFSSPDTGIY